MAVFRLVRVDPTRLGLRIKSTLGAPAFASMEALSTTCKAIPTHKVLRALLGLPFSRGHSGVVITRVICFRFR